MTRTLITLAAASILALGCNHAAETPGALAPAPATMEAAAPASTPASAGAAEAVGSDAQPAPAATATASRMPGDFVVYRFTGAFRKTPLTLTQKVVARKGSVLTVDFVAEEGKDRQELRVRIDEASPTHNEVIAVARLARGVEAPATIEAYEKLMARTGLAADSNDAQLGTAEVTVEVGGKAIPARQTTYSVRVGKRRATLRTLESATFAWGDVGGEITAEGGKVLYRAEVVEAGHDDAAARAAMAE